MKQAGFLFKIPMTMAKNKNCFPKQKTHYPKKKTMALQTMSPMIPIGGLDLHRTA